MARHGRSFPIRSHMNYQGKPGVYFNRSFSQVATETVTVVGSLTRTVGRLLAEVVTVFDGTTGVSSVTNSPGTTVNDATVGTVDWTNPNNTQASDDVYATISRGGTPANSHYLKATNFGFSIPAGATINGILAEIEAKVSSNGSLNNVRLVKGGAIGSTVKATGNFTVSDAYYPVPTTGGSTELWGDTWTPTDINDSTFGVVFAGSISDLNVTSLDHIRITVYYTLGGSLTVVKVTSAAFSEIVTVIGSVVNAAGKSLSETVIISDVIIILKGGVVVLSEAVTIIDSFLRSIVRSITESVVITDVVAPARGLLKTVTEALVVTDVLQREASKLLLDAIAVTDTVGRSIGKSITNTITLVDSLLNNVFKLLEFSDVVAVADRISKTLGRSLAENIIIGNLIGFAKRARDYVLGRNTDTNLKVGVAKSQNTGRNNDTNTKVGTKRT